MLAQQILAVIYQRDELNNGVLLLKSVAQKGELGGRAATIQQHSQG